MKNESAKVNNAPPPIPGNMSYIITKKSRLDVSFSDFLWCIKARSKDITRPNITGILIEPAKICATDGCRIHIITNPYPSIPPGEYEVYQVNQSKVILISKSTTTKDSSFPVWNRTTITMKGKKPEHNIVIDHHGCFYAEILKRRIVDIKLLQDAISNEPMNVKIYGEMQPVIITTLTRTAIVMPLLDRKVS